MVSARHNTGILINPCSFWRTRACLSASSLPTWDMPALCIFHNGPAQRVFTDPRLEVNSREVLERYLQIESLLLQGDPDGEAEAMLRQYAADTTGDPMPALLLDLTPFSRIERLKANPNWRFVFTDGLTAVFLYESKAAELGIPPVDDMLFR